MDLLTLPPGVDLADLPPGRYLFGPNPLPPCTVVLPANAYLYGERDLVVLEIREGPDTQADSGHIVPHR